MATVKISWSGGKDSTCSVLRHLARGDKCILVNYTPMFTKDIPMVLPEHYDFILRAKEYFESQGCEVHIISATKTYYDFCKSLRTRGINKGLPQGMVFYLSRYCNYRKYKIRAMEGFKCDHDYTDIGIAFDEKQRQGQLTEYKRSILVEEHITESQAREICRENNLLSPLYSSVSRDGCILCPNAKITQIEHWLECYPEAKPLLKELNDAQKTIFITNKTHGTTVPYTNRRICKETPDGFLPDYLFE